MATLTATEARKRLYTLVDEVAESHDPIQVFEEKTGSASLRETRRQSLLSFTRPQGPMCKRKSRRC